MQRPTGGQTAQKADPERAAPYAGAASSRKAVGHKRGGSRFCSSLRSKFFGIALTALAFYLIFLYIMLQTVRKAQTSGGHFKIERKTEITTRAPPIPPPAQMNMILDPPQVNTEAVKVEVEVEAAGQPEEGDKERWVRQQVQYSNTRLFMSFGGYIIDGDRSRPSFSASTTDLLLVVLGVGEFTQSAANPNQVKSGKQKLFIPELECRFALDSANPRLVVSPAVVHTNGTAFQGRLDSHGNLKFPAEKGVWISCLLPKEVYADVVGASHGKLLGKMDLVARGGTEFVVDGIPVRSFITPPQHSYELIHCSAPVHSMSGARWLIEWIEYHRAVGFDHLNLYMYKPKDLVLKVAEHYSKEGFVTVYDWSAVSEGPSLQGVHIDNWEHGQRMARNDCYLRNRGVSRYVAFSDVDELFALNSEVDDVLVLQSWLDQRKGRVDMKRFLKWFDLEHALSGGQKIGYAFRSVTVPPFDATSYKIQNEPFTAHGEEMLLSGFCIAERRCQAPYNCGNYHQGRQKYIIRTASGSINPNNPLFYHAISENYVDISDKLMLQVPKHMGYVRHYAGHFKHSRVGGLDLRNRRLLPLPRWILTEIQQAILQPGPVSQLYATLQKERFLKLYLRHDVNRFRKSTDPAPPAQMEVEAAGKPEGYITFERYGGRLNNQLLTYDWVFRLSLAFNRKVFIPKAVEREHWLGLPRSKAEELAGASIWNMELLRKQFSFVMDYDEDFDKDRALLTASSSELPRECVWEYSKHTKFLAEFMRTATSLHTCKDRIHFKTSTGLVHPYRTDTRSFGVGPLVFWSAMQPSKYLQDAAKAFVDEVRSTNPEKSVLGIHSRSHNSYNVPAAKAIKTCNRLALKTLSSSGNHMRMLKECCGKGLAFKDRVSENYEKLKLPAMCNITNEYLTLHDFKNALVVYASDHENKAVDRLLYNGYNAKSFDPKRINRPQFDRVEDKPAYRDNIEMVLADMLVVSKSDYFHGGPSSTVSHVICFWRLARAKLLGFEERSNMCALTLLSTGSPNCDQMTCDQMKLQHFWELVY